MKQRELIDLLADHADALNREADQDVSEWAANSGRLANVPSVLALLQLAQAVKRVFVPVSPSPLFWLELRTRLQQEEDSVVEKRPFPKTIVVGAAVSAIGLTIYLLRRFRPASAGVATAV
jgi:hypothetical protein